MALTELLGQITLEAAADYSTKQFFFVDVDSNGRAILVASAGANAIGVLMNKPDALGKAAEVAVSGVVKVEAGGTVTAGEKVQSDAAGNATTAASADHVLGRAITSGADGEVISVLLISNHILA